MRKHQNATRRHISIIDTKMPYKKMLENSNIRYTKDQIFKQKLRTKEIERKRHEKRKNMRTTQEIGRKRHEKRKGSTKGSENRALDAQKTTH